MIDCLLVGMTGGGGEEVFVRELAENPPPEVGYTTVLGHHESAPGARARTLLEIAYNRLVHPFLWPLPGLKAYRVDDRFDLVHVHNHPHRIARPEGVPVVMTLGGGSYRHYIEAYLGWEEERVDALYDRARRVYRLLGISDEFVAWEDVAGIAVFSDFARSHLLDAGVPPERIRIIPPGFPVPPLPDRPEEPDPFTFLFVGRDPRRKGADLVLEAARSLAGEKGGIRLVMAGDPAHVELDDEPWLEALGVVPRHRLYREVFPGADAFVMPSRAEGFGFTVVEAMSFGLPVVATRQGAFPEIVEEGRTGLLVAVDDAGEVREAMARLAGDPAGARRMGRAGRERFEERYTRERFRGRMRGWYGDVLGTPGG